MWTLVPIALRNVLRNTRRTLITLAALVVGVGVLVFIRGVLNGLQRALVDNVVETTVGALQIHRTGYMKNVLGAPLSLNLPADDAFLAKVQAVRGVKGAAPRIQFAGSVSWGDQTLFVQATGLDPVGDLAVCPRRPDTYASGSRLDGVDSMLLVGSLATAVGAKPGALGMILAPDVDGSLNGENVHFAGLLASTMPGEMKFGVLPLSVAQRLLRMEGRATEIAVAVNDVAQVAQVAADLRTALGPEYEVHTWLEMAPQIVTLMSIQNFAVSFVGGVFLVLMLLGVANTMIMSALERTREIGTMLAVGVRRGRVLGLFLLEAFALGLVGGIAGAATGFLGVTALHQHGITIKIPISSLPFVIHPIIQVPYLVMVVVLAAVGAVASAFYPARRASRLRPVEALAGH